MLLGQGRALYRKVVLNKKHGREAMELQHGLYRATRPLRRSRRPPRFRDPESSPTAHGCCRGGFTSHLFGFTARCCKGSSLASPKKLALECPKLRKERCALYEDAVIDEARAQQLLRENEARQRLWLQLCVWSFVRI